MSCTCPRRIHLVTTKAPFPPHSCSCQAIRGAWLASVTCGCAKGAWQLAGGKGSRQAQGGICRTSTSPQSQTRRGRAAVRGTMRRCRQGDQAPPCTYSERGQEHPGWRAQRSARVSGWRGEGHFGPKGAGGQHLVHGGFCYSSTVAPRLPSQVTTTTGDAKGCIPVEPSCGLGCLAGLVLLREDATPLPPLDPFTG